MTSMRKRLGVGIFYTALSKYSNVFISVIVTAVLARLLSPSEFGIVAVVMVFIVFFRLLSDFGIGPAIIQNKSLTDNDLESIFIFSILFGFALAILFYFSAPLISHFYNNKELEDVVRLLSLSVLFFSFNIVPQSLNYKKYLFKEIGLIAVVVQIISGGIAIYFATKGFRYWALVIKSIIDGLFIFIGNYYFSPVRLNIKIKISSLSKIARFASFQFLFNFFNYFSRNIDNLLIGKYLSISALGYYDKAYQLMMMPVGNITNVITPVLQPVLSEFQNDKKTIFTTYLKTAKVLATIGFPLSVFFFFSAPEIILLLFGKQWVESILIFKILSLTVGFQMVSASSGSIYQAANRTDLLFFSGLLGTVAMVGGITYGIFIGKNLESIGYGLVCSFIFNFFQGSFILVNKALQSSFLRFLKLFIQPVMISIGLALFLWLISKFTIVSPFYSLVIKILVASVAFSLLFLTSSENRKFLYYYLKYYCSTPGN